MKYKEIISYGIFGVLTTAVNYLGYLILVKVLLMPTMLGNAIAFFLSILFAYVTNRRFVFKSYANTLKLRIREFTEFVSARLLGFVLDMAMMFIFVEWLLLNDWIMKGVSNVIVIVLNYAISKYIVFAPKKGESYE